MGKTRDDEDYERGVRDGQRGGFFDDLIQGQTESGSPYDKGYKYGAEHKYGSEGRYHIWDGRGSNDLKIKTDSESKSERKGGKISKERSYDPYFYGSDNDRSYTTRDKDTGEYPKETGAEFAGKMVGAVVLILIGILIFSIVFSIVDNHIKQQKATQRVIKENSLIKIDIARDLRVPVGINDYSLSPDKSQIAFSQRVMTVAHYSAFFLGNKELSRIFLKDLGDGNQRLIDFDITSRETYRNISSNDFVAPLFSPDGRKIAFVNTRSDQPTAVYVANKDGSGLKRISQWGSTIAFGWISSNVLFVWESGYCSANIFAPFVYGSGRSYCVDVIKYIAPNPRDPAAFEKCRYLPLKPIKIKYVGGQVKDFIIRKK